ncbi:MAG: single-stranded DNA-binding protein [Pirellulaceae bacterium]|nr:single-stranded DNA-binding protein [Pirellulaceae bacterium]
MASFNRVILMGNLTRDIDLRYTTSGMAVGDSSVAVNDRRKNQSGEWVDEATFVEVKFFGRTAEIAGEYLSKGSPIHIEGRLKLDTWEKDGQKRSKLFVIVDHMQMIGSKPTGEARANKPQVAEQANEAYSEAPAHTGSSSQNDHQDSFEDSSIPF